MPLDLHALRHLRRRIPRKTAEKRKEELIDRMNLSNAAWLRGINNDSNTFEDVIVGFDEDWKIVRYKQWESFLSSLFVVIKNVESTIIYKYLKT